jgi:hypothetical protein
VRDFIEVEELVSPEPMTEAELLEEINVRAYLRNGRRVVAHIRGGRGPRAARAAKYVAGSVGEARVAGRKKQYAGKPTTYGASQNLFTTLGRDPKLKGRVVIVNNAPMFKVNKLTGAYTDEVVGTKNQRFHPGKAPGNGPGGRGKPIVVDYQELVGKSADEQRLIVRERAQATPQRTSRAQRKENLAAAIAAHNRMADQMNWEIEHGPNDFFDHDGEVYIVPKELNAKDWQEAKKLGTTRSIDDPIPLSQNNPYRDLNEAFIEVNVQAYTRRGKNGLIQVKRHTRGGARVGARAIRRPTNRPERTRLEGYNTKELTGAINDPSNELYQQIRNSSAAAQYADKDRLDAAPMGRR